MFGIRAPTVTGVKTTENNYLEDFNAKVVCHILSVSLDPNVESENDAVLDLVFQHHWRFHDVTLNDGTDFDAGKL